MKCAELDCGNDATLTATVVEKRQCVHEAFLCEEHGLLMLSKTRGAAVDAATQAGDAAGESQCDVDLVVFHHQAQLHDVLLRTFDGKESLVLSVGPVEASTVVATLRYHETNRPLTHELLRRAIEALGAKAEAARIERKPVATEAYHLAGIRLASGNDRCYLDARPTDAICVAIRAGVPILLCDQAVEDQATASVTTEERTTDNDQGQLLFRGTYAFRKEGTGKNIAAWLAVVGLGIGLFAWQARAIATHPAALSVALLVLAVLVAIGASHTHAWLMRRVNELEIRPSAVTYGKERWRWTDLAAIRIGRNRPTGALCITIWKRRIGRVGRALVVDDVLGADEMQALAEGIQQHVTRQRLPTVVTCEPEA